MFWLEAFGALVKVIGWLSGLAGYFHDRGQQKLGATSQVARDTAATVSAYKDALKAKTSAPVDKAELEQTLKDGKL